MSLVSGLWSVRTWLAFTHHVAGLFLGIVSAVIAIVGITLGVGLLPLALVGVPVLGLTTRFSDAVAALERARFALLLDAPVPAWPDSQGPRFRWALVPRMGTLTGRRGRGQLGYAALRLPASVLSFTLVTVAWTAGVVGVTLPIYAGLLPGGSISFDGNPVRWSGAVPFAIAIGVVALLCAPPLTRSLAAADTAMARWLLAPPANADLAARVTELEVSRERVVDAAEAERRRIERDLHDGAQQRLVAVAMELGRAKAKFGDDVEAAAALVDQAHAEAKAALTELRELVRGVHPPVLTDRGLDAALSGLAARCSVPVTLQVDVPVRPRTAVEAVAYFTVAEALTNIAKHSRATHASVVVEGGPRGGGTLRLVITDDGIGGADPAGGGLSGLADRISGVDGMLSVESPSGGPTIVSAVLPC